MNKNPALENEANVMGKKAADSHLVNPAFTDNSQNIRRKEDENELSDPELPKYKRKVVFNPKRLNKKFDAISIKFQGVIYTDYILESENSETESSGMESNSSIKPQVSFEHDYISGQIALAVKSEKATIIDFGSGIKAKIGATFFKVDSNGKFSAAVLEIPFQGRITADSEDGPFKRFLISKYGYTLFNSGGVVDLEGKVEIDTIKATRKIAEFANKHQRELKKLEKQAKKIEEEAKMLQKQRNAKRQKFVKEEIAEYRKRNGKMPSKSKIEKFAKKFNRTDANKILRDRVKDLRKHTKSIEKQVKKINKILTKQIKRATGLLDIPVLKRTLSFGSKLLKFLGPIFEVIEAVIVAYQISDAFMSNGINPGFTPSNLLNGIEKGPGFDNPPIFVKGSGEDATELQHNEPLNFIITAGKGGEEKQVGSGHGDQEGKEEAITHPTKMNNGNGYSISDQDEEQNATKSGKTTKQEGNGKSTDGIKQVNTISGGKGNSAGIKGEEAEVDSQIGGTSVGKTEEINDEAKKTGQISESEIRTIYTDSYIPGEEFDGRKIKTSKVVVELKNKSSITSNSANSAKITLDVYISPTVLLHAIIETVNGIVIIDDFEEGKEQWIRFKTNKSIVVPFDSGKICIKSGKTFKVERIK